MAQGGPARGGAGDLEFAVVGMRAEGDDAQLAVVGGHGDAGNRGEEGGGEAEEKCREKETRGDGAGEVHGTGSVELEP